MEKRSTNSVQGGIHTCMHLRVTCHVGGALMATENKDFEKTQKKSQKVMEMEEGTYMSIT